MHDSIDGRNCELLRIELDTTEAVIAEVGKMVYMRGPCSARATRPQTVTRSSRCMSH